MNDLGDTSDETLTAGGAPQGGNGLGGGGGNGDLIKDGTVETFMADVMEASAKIPVIVDFWAPWCEPCKQLTPMLEEGVRAAGGKLRLVKINVDENQGLAQQLQVKSVPAVYLFKNGQPADGFVGMQQPSQIRAFVDKAAGGAGQAQEEALLAAAKAAEAEGDTGTAVAAYQEVLRADDGNPNAIAGLAKLALASGDADTARAMLEQVPEEHAEHAEIQSARTALELAAQSGDGGETEELQRAVDADPKNLQARYDLACALSGQGAHEAAIDHLLVIVEHKQDWNNKAAREQLLKIFEALGHADPVTVEGRRRLSALLFS